MRILVTKYSLWSVWQFTAGSVSSRERERDVLIFCRDVDRSVRHVDECREMVSTLSRIRYGGLHAVNIFLLHEEWIFQ
jgi:hypothetical protein